MNKKIVIIIVALLCISCDSLLIFKDTETSSGSEYNYNPELINTLDSELNDFGHIDSYFYNFNDDINLKFLRKKYIHFNGGDWNPDSDEDGNVDPNFADTLNFQTYPDFLVNISNQIDCSEFDSEGCNGSFVNGYDGFIYECVWEDDSCTNAVTSESISEPILDLVTDAENEDDIDFEINDATSTIRKLVWETVSGGEQRYVPYTTRLENITEQHTIEIKDQYTNVFHQSIIDEYENFVDENENGIWDDGEYLNDINGNEEFDVFDNGYFIIDSTAWDTVITFVNIESSNIDTIPNGIENLESLGDHSILAYEFKIDTMVVISEDSLMFIDLDGTIGTKMDSLLISFIDEAYNDLNGNGIHDPDAEPYVDSNDNGEYDLAEEWEDSNDNGIWDSEEDFTDLNGNGVADYIDDNDTVSGFGGCAGVVAILGCDYVISGVPVSEICPVTCGTDEDYEDSNNNDIWDPAEDFTDTNGNGICDPAEDFTDTNGNESYDFSEPYTDENANGSYDTFVETALDTIYPGDYVISEEGDSTLILEMLFDYSYYKHKTITNINYRYETVNAHIIAQDSMDLSEYKIGKTQFEELNPANGQISSDYDYHLFKFDDHIKALTYPSYFEYYGLTEQGSSTDNTFDFFGNHDPTNFWFEEESIDEVLFFLSNGQYLRDGEIIQSFSIDTTEHAIYFINKEYTVERDTVTIPYKNEKWDRRGCFANGYPSYLDKEQCVNAGFLWVDSEEILEYNDTNLNGVWDNSESFIDDNGNGIWDDGEYLNDINGNGTWDSYEEVTSYVDSETYILKPDCFKITRTLNMEMKGNSMTYNEKGETWLVRDLYIARDRVYFSWNNDPWDPFSELILHEFREDSGSPSSFGILSDILGQASRLKISSLENIPEFNYDPYKKARKVGIQRMGVSE